MALFGLLLTICYIPGVTGFALPTGWLVLTATLPWILRRELLRIWRQPFLWWAAFGLTWTVVWQQGVYDLWKLIILACVFVLGQTRIDTSRLLTGMAIGLAISCMIAVAQLFGSSSVPSLDDVPAGLFFNRNILGEVSVLVAVGLIAHGLWPLALPALANILLSESRTAIFALGVCGSIWLWKRYALAGPLIILIVALSTTGYLFDKTVANATYRIAIWSATIDGFTWLGRGPGSFITTFPAFAKFHTEPMPNREEDAHSEPLQLAYQYGLGAFLLLPILAVGFFGPLGPERYLLIAFAICACFNYPLEVPPSAFLGSFALGRLWADRHSLRWYRLVCGWLIRGRLALWQLCLGPGWSPTLPLEPIHPHQTGILRNGLRHS